MNKDAENLNVQDSLSVLILPSPSICIVAPNVTIAEVSTLNKFQKSNGLVDWLIGSIEWRGIRIPLISFEKMNGFDVSADLATERCIIFNGITSKDTLPFYAILSYGIPKQIKLKSADVKAGDGGNRGKMELSRVYITDLEASIPDFEAIETELTTAYST